MSDSHQRALEALDRRGRLRALAPRAGLDFSSNDYLGLAGSPELTRAVAEALDRGVAVGAGGSRLLRGNDPEHAHLEEEAAAMFGAERCLYFGGGFPANTALFSTLPQRGDLIVYDELVHASVHDGMRASKAEFLSATHNNVQHIDDIISSWRNSGGIGRPWIAVESLYSMDGDVAPLDQLVQVARRHDGVLVVDEAHATGVLGPDGRGLAAHLEGASDVVSLHTCGKALGASGALVCASKVFCDFLVNRARPLVYATAPSPLMAAAVRASLRILRDEPDRRLKLGERVKTVSSAVQNRCGIDPSGSHILPIILQKDERAVQAAAMLQQRGFDIRAIRPPTVPEGTARLRISLTLNVSDADIEGMLDALSDAIRGEIA